jgi:hypothetical protein
MPQLVKGGKYAYGWSKVDKNGKIIIPREAAEEYNLSPQKAILLPGSKTSGGFGLTTLDLLGNTPLADRIGSSPLANFSMPEGEPVKIKGRVYCWVELHENSITVPVDTLRAYGVAPNDLLLSVRGSHAALGFIVKGPIIEEANLHAELEVVL